MIRRYNKKIVIFSFLVVLLVSLMVLLFFVSPEEIVDKVGVHNGYIFAFIISFFGGFSAGGSVTFISFLIVLVQGGLNPIYLGLLAGVSLAIGDMIMFYIGSRGRELVGGKWDEKINKVSKVLKKKKWLEKLVPIVSYLYIGFLPLPNDILILFLAGIEYPIKKMKWIIFLGDITFALIVTMLVSVSG